MKQGYTVSTSIYQKPYLYCSSTSCILVVNQIVLWKTAFLESIHCFGSLRRICHGGGEGGHHVDVIDVLGGFICLFLLFEIPSSNLP